jgi:hypothetical protein
MGESVPHEVGASGPLPQSYTITRDTTERRDISGQRSAPKTANVTATTTARRLSAQRMPSTLSLPPKLWASGSSAPFSLICVSPNNFKLMHYPERHRLDDENRSGTLRSIRDHSTALDGLFRSPTTAPAIGGASASARRGSSSPNRSLRRLRRGRSNHPSARAGPNPPKGVYRRDDQVMTSAPYRRTAFQARQRNY